MADVTVTPAQMYRAANALAEALTALGREAEAVQTLDAVLGRRERESGCAVVGVPVRRSARRPAGQTFVLAHDVQALMAAARAEALAVRTR